MTGNVLYSTRRYTQSNRDAIYLYIIANISNYENNHSKLDWLNDYLYDKRGVNALQAKGKNSHRKMHDKNTR